MWWHLQSSATKAQRHCVWLSFACPSKMVPLEFQSKDSLHLHLQSCATIVSVVCISNQDGSKGGMPLGLQTLGFIFHVSLKKPPLEEWRKHDELVFPEEKTSFMTHCRKCASSVCVDCITTQDGSKVALMSKHAIVIASKQLEQVKMCCNELMLVDCCGSYSTQEKLLLSTVV